MYVRTSATKRKSLTVRQSLGEYLELLLASLSYRWNRTSLWVIPPRPEHVADEDRARSSQIMSHAIRFRRRDSHHRSGRRAAHNGINMRLCPHVALKLSERYLLYAAELSYRYLPGTFPARLIKEFILTCLTNTTRILRLILMWY